MANKSKALIVSEVLGRISQDRYEVRTESEGEVITVKNYGVTLGEIEDYFREPIEALYAMQAKLQEDVYSEVSEYDPLAHGFPLEDYWSNWWTFQLLRQIFPDVLGDKEPPHEQRPQDYTTVLTRLYEGMQKNSFKTARQIVDGRETLSNPQVEELEQSLMSTYTAANATDLIATAYARRLAGAFPKMVRRMEGLRALDARVPASDRVQAYLAEATRCYVYGLFTSCLITCRSAVELAVRDFLLREGKAEELKTLRAEQGDSLWAMINLARSLGKWRLKPTLDDADEVRRRAVPAVHHGEAGVETCREVFEKTRGVLRELYA